MAVSETITDRAFTIILGLLSEAPPLGTRGLSMVRAWMDEYKADLDQRHTSQSAAKDGAPIAVTSWAAVHEFSAEYVKDAEEGIRMAREFMAKSLREANDGMDQRG